MKKIKIENIFYYIQGMYRYYLYYSKFKILIRRHIREQINLRISIMDKKCYNDGTCKLCGCITTALQMCNKPCDKPCYPVMMNKRLWNNFKVCYNYLILKYKLEDDYFKNIYKKLATENSYFNKFAMKDIIMEDILINLINK